MKKHILIIIFALITLLIIPLVNSAQDDDLDLPPEPSMSQFNVKQDGASPLSPPPEEDSNLYLYLIIGTIGLIILIIVIGIIYYLKKVKTPKTITKQPTKPIQRLPIKQKQFINPYPGDAFADYIYTHLNKGYPKQQIYQKFISQGYKPAQIDRYFKGIK